MTQRRGWLQRSMVPARAITTYSTNHAETKLAEWRGIVHFHRLAAASLGSSVPQLNRAAVGRAPTAARSPIFSWASRSPSDSLPLLSMLPSSCPCSVSDSSLRRSGAGRYAVAHTRQRVHVWLCARRRHDRRLDDHRATVKANLSSTCAAFHHFQTSKMDLNLNLAQNLS